LSYPFVFKLGFLMSKVFIGTEGRTSRKKVVVKKTVFRIQFQGITHANYLRSTQIQRFQVIKKDLVACQREGTIWVDNSNGHEKVRGGKP